MTILNEIIHISSNRIKKAKKNGEHIMEIYPNYLYCFLVFNYISAAAFMFTYLHLHES